MHVGFANPRWQGKRFRHSRRMSTPNFTYLERGLLKPCQYGCHFKDDIFKCIFLEWQTSRLYWNYPKFYSLRSNRQQFIIDWGNGALGQKVIVWSNGIIFTRGQFGLRILPLPVCVRMFVNYEVVCAITCRKFELESSNLDQICLTFCLRSLLFWGLIELDLPGEI